MSTALPQSVLLVIDLQQAIVSPKPEWGSRSTPSLTTNVSTILSLWRLLHRPLIHIHHHPTDASDPLHPSHPATSAGHSCAAPLPNETVLIKSTGSAFVGTSLLEKLQKLMNSNEGKEKTLKLVIIGMDGAQCVNSTTRSAADLGFEVTVVADACASSGTQDWKKGDSRGKGWDAEATHDLAMAMLAGGYAQVILTSQLLESLE
ncbi:unnamed protein product [Calypogeia fissa]